MSRKDVVKEVARADKKAAENRLLGLTEEQVRARLWESFCAWMYGQTCGLDSDGQVRYYEYDVERFCRARRGTPVID